MNRKRESWGSNIGFLMAAIGSAVGLGNIWAFPYKMGRSGGFTFLIIYLILGALVGFTIMMSELAMGRKTGMGVVGAYHKLSRRFGWIGWLAVLSPLLILSFYTVLGGYCLEYIFLNLSNLGFTAGSATGSELFSALRQNQFGSLIFTLFYLLIGYVIIKGGIKGGIERFNKVGMPALAVMLLIVIGRSVTLPGAVDGLKYMFVPGWSVANGYMDEAPSFIQVLSTAGGQMFFSLSLAMGIMVTYGSYLDKKENLVKNSIVVVIADTAMALMAGLAVIPAAIATYGTDAQLSGPSLLFVTLQDVFNAMGVVGPLFGAIFYLLVLVAAVSSSISLTEVLVTFVMDHGALRGRVPSRRKVSMAVSAVVMVLAVLVALDGLGANGLWIPLRNETAYLKDGVLTYRTFAGSWLDFMDCLSEGIMMPLGAVLMSFMVGWELKPKTILDEVGEPARKPWLRYFYTISIRFIVPVIMVLVLAGQLMEFFGRK